MIIFKNQSHAEPYKKIKKYYDKAIDSNQNSIEAISISSYNTHKQEVNSRLVNLKFIDNEEFIFFSNYKSTKSIEFQSHNQISAILFWPAIKLQIRFKGKISQKSQEFNERYFKARSLEKNALAISSNQSEIINSFQDVINKFERTKKTKNLSKCPLYWGGYSFRPFEIEFWEGGEFRLNKRNLYRKDNATWNHFILEP